MVKEEFNNDPLKVEKIIAVNYDSFAVRGLHFFKNLNTVYLLDAQKDTLLPANSGLNAITNNKVVELTLVEYAYDVFKRSKYGEVMQLSVTEKNNTVYMYTVYVERIIEDDFFRSMNWTVYRIQVNSPGRYQRENFG